MSDATDSDLTTLKSELGERYGLIEAIKGIYDYFILKTTLNGASTVSEAMVGMYDKFYSDLVRLKRFVRKYYSSEIYNLIFKNSENSIKNFVSYIGYTKPKRTKVKVKKCKPEEFFEWLVKTLEKNFSDSDNRDELNAITAEIKAGTFLKKILHADNGVFPHQLNLSELELILKNLVRDYPIFGEIDSDGLSAEQKIVALFKFRIPYYVGPLNIYGGSKNAWAVRKERGAVTPWNFENKIDVSESGENFIRRMTNTCSYLRGEPVLPASSPIYERFNTLNIINKLKIYEQPISIELKKRLFDELYSVDPRVTDKKVIDFLKLNGYIDPSETRKDILGGRDSEASHPSMATYIKLKSILGTLVDVHPEIAENIILWHTLHTDKKIVKKLIIKNYGSVKVVNDNIEKLLSITVKGFGKLSEKFLTKLYVKDNFTGANCSVLDILYETNLNLMELVETDIYNFKAQIDEFNAGDEDDGDIKYEDVEESVSSPKVRRGVWQAITMTKEYIQAVGNAPEKIFVEVTRAPEKEKKRTESRKRKLQKMYEAMNVDRELLERLEGYDDIKLRQERLYLYFLQLGKCAYSGEQINLDEINTDTYDVDHIVPQSLVKDDGLENKVLVKRTLNAAKSDNYPIPSELVQSKAKENWAIWRKAGLMGAKKYNSLTRVNPLTEADLNGFIARQIVETGQTAKAVITLLKRMCPESKIYYSKGGNVSDFRQRYGIVKCRETNDLHHARDAYLNIVVGNVYYTRFPSVGSYYRDRGENDLRRYNLERLFDFDVNGAWVKGKSLELVKKTCFKTSMAVTRYTFTGNGKFYDETVYDKGDKGISVPRCQKGPLSNVQSYGGYKTLNTAYFVIAESEGKKGMRQTIEAIPVYYDYVIKDNREKLLEYLKDKGLKNPRLIVPKVRIKTLFKIEGMLLYIAGISGNTVLYHNAVQWFTDQKTDRYCKSLGKLIEMKKKNFIAEDREVYEMTVNSKKEVSEKIDQIQNIGLYDSIIEKLGSKIYSISPVRTFVNNLETGREKFIGLSTYDQAEVLMECIKFMESNKLLSNLSAIGAGKYCGTLSLNKDITNLNVSIIHTSACGLNVRERKIE